jgi:hypothetical protein
MMVQRIQKESLPILDDSNQLMHFLILERSAQGKNFDYLKWQRKTIRLLQFKVTIKFEPIN